jgi:HEAT repeat protein
LPSKEHDAAKVELYFCFKIIFKRREMNKDPDKIRELTEQLLSKASPKRRAAAKRLRQLKDASAGPAVLEALRHELRDERTWETQYQMIMALGESDYKEALPLLWTIASQKTEHSMVQVAAGDAILRLSRAHEQDPGPLFEILSTGQPALIEGALRAVAMLRLTLDEKGVRAVVEYASQPENEPVRFWAAAAAAGWDGPHVEEFLHLCSTARLEDTRKAAAAASKKEYLNWKPL